MFEFSIKTTMIAVGLSALALGGCQERETEPGLEGPIERPTEPGLEGPVEPEREGGVMEEEEGFGEEEAVEPGIEGEAEPGL